MVPNGAPGGGSAGTQRMCPSTPAERATVFLGMIGPTRRVAYITPRMPVTPELLVSLQRDNRPVEQLYRFAGRCVEHDCGFWTGEHCALGARISQSYRSAVGAENEAALPHCAIRADCRWFAEQGRDACTACPHVVTEARLA